MGTKIERNTEASHIYDVIYGPIANKENYKVSNSTKSARIEQILATMDFEEKTVLRACCKYQGLYSSGTASKVTKIEQKRLAKIYKQARRHMYAPNNIRIAIPKFYKISKVHQKKLSEYDFDGQKYIYTALLKSGLDTKEKLVKHLSLGWYYLWTIPGCGDNARQTILLTIDKWNSNK